MIPVKIFGADNARTIVVFASEKIVNQWIESVFHSYASSNKVIEPNECERAIGESLRMNNFETPENSATDTQRIDARRFHAVFARYNDMSVMPNETVARAAAIIHDSLAVIACGVRTSGKNGSNVVCAVADCKIVDMRSRRRIVTAADEKCVENADSMMGSLAAVRSVCLNIGNTIAKKITDKF